MNEDKIGKGITPISRGMKYQQLSTPKDVDISKIKGLKEYDIELNGRTIKILYDGNGGVYIGSKLYQTKVEDESDGIYLAKVEVTKRQVHKYKIEMHDGIIFLEGRKAMFGFKPAVPKLQRKKSSKIGGEEIRAPLPGNITSIPVKVGDEIIVGQRVAILEAMKMQNDLLSTVSGFVKEIKIKEGAQVITDQLILIISPKLQEKS